MSLLSTSHTFSFKRTKNILHTILLSICFVFANSAFATSNPSSSISQNTEVYLVTTDWIDSSSTLIFNPVSEKYFLSKTESSNNSLVFSQPFPNPDTDGDGIEDAIDLDDDNDGISDTVELLSIDAALWLDASDSSTIEENGGKVSQWDDKSGNNNHLTQATDANQPTTGTRSQNGLNVLDFNGDYLTKVFAVAQPYTVFAVAKSDAPTGGQNFFGNTDNSPITYLGHYSSVWRWYSAPQQVDGLGYRLKLSPLFSRSQRSYSRNGAVDGRYK